MIPLILLLFYFGFCFAVAYAGRNVTIGFWGVLVMSIFFTPLVTALFIVVLRPKYKKREKRELDYLEDY